MEFNYFFSQLVINLVISIGIFIVGFIFFNIVVKSKLYAKWIKNKKTYWVWLSFFSTLISATIALLLTENFYSCALYNIFVGFIYALLFSSFIGYTTSFINLVISLIFYFTKLIDFSIFLNVILICSLIIIFNFLSWIFISKNNLLVFVYFLLIAVAMNINLLFIEKGTFNALLIVKNISYFIYMMIIYILTKPFDKFISNIKNINQNIYTKNNFILNKFVDKFFNEFKIKNNLKYGYLFVINFKEYENLYNEFSASLINSIKVKILKEIKESFSDTTSFYFITKSNEYAFLVKTDSIQNLQIAINGNMLLNRIDGDPFKECENKLANIPKILNIDNKSSIVNLQLNAALFGVQNNDLNKLIELCDVNNLSKNIINWCVRKKQNELIDVKKNNILIYENLFNPKQSIIKFEEIQINKKYYLYGCPSLINNLLFSWIDFLNLSSNKEVRDAIISHLSSLVLKNCNKEKNIIINYHQHSLSDINFDIYEFLEKIKITYGVKKFCFNIVIEDPNINDIFVKNIKLLRSQDIACYLHISSDIKTKNVFQSIKLTKIQYKVKHSNHTVDLLPNFEVKS